MDKKSGLQLFALIVLLHSGALHALQIEITSSHNLAVQGDQVDFVCRVTGAAPGDLIYYTKQVARAGEATVTELISSNHILTPLYESFGRFEAEVANTGDATLFLLSVMGVTEEDTGFYGCIDAVTKTSDSLRLDVYKQASNVSFVGHAPNEPYVFIEGESQEVTCFVDDVVPIPNVQFYIDSTDYSDGFDKTYTEDVKCDGAIGTKTCPLYYNYDVTVTNPSFTVPYEANGRMLFCASRMSVSHHSLAPVSARIPIIVKYSPKFHCDTVMDGRVGDSANITCSLSSNPLPQLVTWHFYIDGSHVQIDSGESMDGYHAFEEALPSGQDKLYTLHIEEVDSSHFTTYKLQTVQEVANHSIEITMNEYIVTTAPDAGDAATAVGVTSYLFFLLALLCLAL